tara:strand:+ start:4122 stop:6506 length:2385 start_codon:yes stop_codon:yes gene_type:complete
MHISKASVRDKLYFNAKDCNLEEITENFSYSYGLETFTTLQKIDENKYALPANTIHKLDIENLEDNRVWEKLDYELEYVGTPYPEQRDSIDKFIQGRSIKSGILQARCGWGKSFTASYLISQANVKCLVLVHTKLLFNQWINELEEQLPHSKIGRIGDGLFELHDVTVAIYKSAYNNIDKIKDEFSLLIVDECLEYDSTVIDDKGNKIKIGKIVNNKLTPNILCYNENNNKYEYKKVYNWFKQPQEEFLYIKTNNRSNLKCTNNHNIYVWDKKGIIKKQAKEIKKNDLLVANKTTRSSFVIKKDILPILLGLIIGDGGLDKSRDGTTRLKITHGEKQKKYLQYKTSILEKLFVAKEVIGKSGYAPQNNTVSKNSLSFVDNYRLINQLYLDQPSKCNITKEIKSYITDITWAFIYQDDGSLSNNQITFSVCELNDDSCTLLIESLKTIFNLMDPYVFKCKKGFNYIRLKTKDTNRFLEQINKYIHPSMSYKSLNYKKEEFIVLRYDDIFEEYTLKSVKEITTCKSYNGYRYNISIEDNHNYIANNILVGNCHNAPANIFSTTVNSCSAKVKIGISATPERKDGRHQLLPDYFTDFLIVGIEKENSVEVPRVSIIATDVVFPVFNNPKREWTKAINSLCSDSNYIDKVINIVNSLVRQGRCVLVLNDRVGTLRDMKKRIKRSGLLIGATKEEERQEIITNAGIAYDVLLSTKLFDEGISCHRLDTLVITCPTSNTIKLEQRVGRIEREHPEKQEPLIVDFSLKGPIAVAQLQKRIRWYEMERTSPLKQAYKIDYTI